MAFKLIESAQRRWQMVSAPHLVALVPRRRHVRQRQARRAARRSVTGRQQPAGCSRGGGCQSRLKDLDPQVLTITLRSVVNAANRRPVRGQSISTRIDTIHKRVFSRAS